MTYFINEKEKGVVNGDTGEIVRPSCFGDLVVYHSYLLSKQHPQFAQNLLRDVFAGEKVITKMINNSQKCRGESNGTA